MKKLNPSKNEFNYNDIVLYLGKNARVSSKVRDGKVEIEWLPGKFMVVSIKELKK